MLSRTFAAFPFRSILRLNTSEVLSWRTTSTSRCFEQGVDAWNAWRRENPDIRPDLAEANLSAADLFKAEGSAEYGMFEHFKHYPWVLKTYAYPSSERLIADLGERVIGPAEDYARSIR